MSLLLDETNRLIIEEQLYDTEYLGTEASQLESGLNQEQKEVYEAIQQAVYQRNGGLFFVYGSGGTGKTYLWRTLISKLRSQNHVVIAVASSGITALLLPSGKTAHSGFSIPINIHEKSCCRISQGSSLAFLIQNTKLIIWDEAPTVHRHAFEAVDRTFRDIMQVINPAAKDQVFGGKTVVLGGDFRQILPVIPRKGRAEIVDGSISKSNTLWPHCKVFKLTMNMRLQGTADQIGKQELAQFSQWVLDVGDGKIPAIVMEGEEEPNWIEIPDDILLKDKGDKKKAIIQEIYPDLLNKYRDLNYLTERAILTPKNEGVDEINNYILGMIPGDEHIYKSADRICPFTNTSTNDEVLYPTEFLNTLQFPGIPNHEIRLKVGCPIILTRNISQSEGLCNGTRLIVSRLDTRVIQAKVVTGTNVGEQVAIPRVEVSPTDSTLPFTLKRRQFPVKFQESQVEVVSKFV
ncbi:uncharacterized protein [Spinacia oleracea]|uniref:ATP-dependent DNA helicase n=1 Tax=Spinacia oleracea TaxID=3562 RepID=A0ABM3QRB7_SPIOL|nr:uncharacterized protein LOC130461738 [Spinacia oleracea]